MTSGDRIVRPWAIVYLVALTSCGTSDPGPSLDAAGQVTVDRDSGLQYLERSLLAPAIRPRDLRDLSIDCELESQPETDLYRTSDDINYNRPGWEHRLAADWRFFDAPASDGWLTVIDFRRVRDRLAYRYLANDDSHDRLYEPWSSSKIYAFTAAVSALREHGIGADASVGGVELKDLITSINTYAPSGNATGDSNAIATYLLSVAGRDYATALLHKNWLKLANADVRLRGAYGPSTFAPPSNEFVSTDGSTRVIPDVYNPANNDPGYRSYRCDQCGTDGNKAMTALAQTEWLKRLASHTREPSTRHPGLETSDVETLFFGGQQQQEGEVGGMLSGISVFLPRALARAVTSDANGNAKDSLDAVTNGRWRVYQKVGWGPSETRGTSELVMLAHVCLPGVGQTGREFTLLARATVPGDDADESKVGEAGWKLERLLDRSLPQLLP